MNVIGMEYSKDASNSIHKWLDEKLLAMLLLVGDFNFIGSRDMVMKAKEELKLNVGNKSKTNHEVYSTSQSA